ncbi:Multidrug resistance protein MdtH OS=Lysinibacillus sphaericus OX=1421 GN=mdtH_3 PE=4 SV=1 [Lysinibacillus sphaericus]
MSRWKYPLMLLGGIGISNVGAWVYLIALNLILLNETGSPLAIALLYILGQSQRFFQILGQVA